VKAVGPPSRLHLSATAPRYSSSVGLGSSLFERKDGDEGEGSASLLGSTAQRCRPRKRHWGNMAKPLAAARRLCCLITATKTPLEDAHPVHMISWSGRGV